MFFLSKNTSTYESVRDLSQAVSLYVATCDDLIKTVLQFGEKILLSSYTFFVFSNDDIPEVSLIER